MMRLKLLRVVLLVDAAVLFLLGVLFVLVPTRVLAAFHFTGLPEGVTYIIGLWGCVELTLALGYLVASRDPIRHLIWVQIGIARGALECGLGALYLSRGIVTWPQARLGIIAAALMTLAYLAAYPRTARSVA
jgi:hypothetical protein